MMQGRKDMKVLVAIDDSGASQYVISEAAARPWPTGTVFCVQCVVDTWASDEMPELIEDAKRQAKSLVTAATCVLSRSGYEVVSEIQAGVPKKAIVEYANNWGADLVMVGSHRSNAVARFLLGSVSRAVLRSALCSVEIVRPGPRALPASSPGMKIIVATDGSNCSQKAVHVIANRPWPPQTLVRVISIREPIAPESGTFFSYETLYPANLADELLEREFLRAEDALTNARNILNSAGLKLSDSSETLFGDPRNILLDEATSWGADLVALGSHGRHGFDRVLLGSVSESVAVHAHCSVEVVRDNATAGE
jgi:nucleotide-binding universal stress UspA family protein